MSSRLLRQVAGLCLAAGGAWNAAVMPAQPVMPVARGGLAIHGTVLDAQGQPAAGATVLLRTADGKTTLATKTTTNGSFSFERLAVTAYTVEAQKGEGRSSKLELLGEPSQAAALTLVLTSDRQNAVAAMEFSDQPHFSVAGVADWTAAGGHGSDATLRTSESLANTTAQLKPEHRDLPGNAAAAALRTAAEADERSGDALAAVRKFEQAATLDPSEQNEFDWASDLLLHRAIWQAETVFRKGAGLYPNSLRMQAGLGAALFAGARYDDAALQLCKASDLDPANPGPYLLLGKIELAAPGPLTCVMPKLARFAEANPRNPMAKYLYAMALLKNEQGAVSSQHLDLAKELLQTAVSLDPKCGDALLELGILAAAKHDTQAAIGFYSEAIAADPQSADAHYRLGVAYDRTGDHVRATQELLLHQQIQQKQAEEAEEQRKAVKQFLFAKPSDTDPSPSH